MIVMIILGHFVDVDDQKSPIRWNPEDSSTNDNEALLVEKEDSAPTVGVPEPERYLPRYNPPPPPPILTLYLSTMSKSYL